MANTTETGLPGAVAIAWGMHEAPQRGPNRGMSHERIVAAAIEIADTEGLHAVTMQAVAKALGFTNMSLYRYVSNKDELLRLMQDAATKFPEEIRLSGDWKTALKQWADLVRHAYRAHPWALDIARDHTSVLMPNSVRAADACFGALKNLNLDDQTKVGVILVISQHVAAMVQLELSLADEGEATITAEGLGQLSEVITEKRFPNIAELMVHGNYVATPTAASASHEQDDEGIEAEFSLGLDLIISGLEVLEKEQRPTHG